MTRIEAPKTNIEDNIVRILGTTIAKPFVARLGDPSQDYKVKVDDTDKLGLLYIHRIGDTPDSAYTAENTLGITQLLPRTLVKVKPAENGRFEIVGLGSENAEYLDGVNTNDQTLVSRSQMSDGGLLPTDSSSVLSVGTTYLVDNVPYNTSDKDTGNLLDGSTDDTSATAIQPPSTANRAIVVLVQENPTTDTLSYKQSSEFPAAYSYNLMASNSLLPAIDDNNVLKGYVKLINGMSTIGREHITSLPDIFRIVNAPSELSDLSDVGSTTPTAQNLLVADGDSWESVAPSTVTVATGDLVIIQDVDDSNNYKRVTAQSVADLGGGGGSTLKMWLGSAFSSFSIGNGYGDVTWDNNYITDTNYWSSSNRQKLLVNDATKDYIIEVGFRLHADTADDGIDIAFRRYNSSDSLQSTSTPAVSFYVPFDSSLGNSVWVSTHYRFAASAISAGDYFTVPVRRSFSDTLIDLANCRCKLYELDAV